MELRILNYLLKSDKVIQNHTSYKKLRKRRIKIKNKIKNNIKMWSMQIAFCMYLKNLITLSLLPALHNSWNTYQRFFKMFLSSLSLISHLPLFLFSTPQSRLRLLWVVPGMHQEGASFLLRTYPSDSIQDVVTCV